MTMGYSRPARLGLVYDQLLNAYKYVCLTNNFLAFIRKEEDFLAVTVIKLESRAHLNFL